MRISNRRKVRGVPAIAEDGTPYYQFEVFPSRLLNLETAQRLIDELNRTDGITRMIVYGPRMPPDSVDDLLEGRFKPKDKKYLTILGERVELSVQVGRIWIEASCYEAMDKIKAACEKTLPFSFELNEGMYLRTKKTVSDYLKTGGNIEHVDLGMFDSSLKKSSCCAIKEKQVKKHGAGDSEGYV